jgi:hypothetical protein
LLSQLRLLRLLLPQNLVDIPHRYVLLLALYGRKSHRVNAGHETPDYVRNRGNAGMVRAEPRWGEKAREDICLSSSYYLLRYLAESRCPFIFMLGQCLQIAKTYRVME